jgi:tRNA (guanine10-N2)-dimethyltransferase
VYALELVGEEDDFAAREAATAAGDVRVVAPGLALARSLDRERVRTLAYTRAASRLVGQTDATVESARAVAETGDLDGRTGTVAVRARNVRATADVSTSDAERAVGAALVERGFDVDLDDPDHELRVLFADDTCLLGWLDTESIRDFGNRNPTDRPFFQPGSMSPLDARAYANLAGARPDRLLVDPMCGTGGLLVEAGLAGSRVLGVDAQEKMAAGASRNLTEYLPADATFGVARGDATCLPLPDDAADGVVVDAPYGRQSKIARHDLDDLVEGALGEAARIAPRCVLIADREWREQAENAGWHTEVVFDRRVHRSLVRYVHVLGKE